MFKKHIFDEDCDDYYHNEGGDDEIKNRYKDDLDGFQVKENGIQRDRGCTDILCLLLFWAFIGAMVFATNYGYK